MESKPDKVLLYYMYEDIECNYKDDYEALKTVYPETPVIVVILNFPEMNLPYPKVEEDVFVIDVISNMLEDGGNLLQLTKRILEN